MLTGRPQGNDQEGLTIASARGRRFDVRMDVRWTRFWIHYSRRNGRI